MNIRFKLLTFFLILGGSILAACGAAEAPTPDLVATEVAVKKAAAATLTAESPTEVPAPTIEDVLPTETPTVAPSPTTTPTAADTAPAETPTAVPTDAPPTPTPLPTATPSPTLVPPTATPSPTPVPPTATQIPPTPTPPLLVGVPVDGGQQDLEGQIIIPGFTPEELQGPEFDGVIFRDRLVFRVEVFDPNEGQHDGAGIEQVRITINGGPDEDYPVHERTERTAGYCVFGGGEPDCNVLFFANEDYRWPENERPPIENGKYRAAIEITTKDNETEEWNWRFWIQIQE